jgi:hypothetical protein
MYVDLPVTVKNQYRRTHVQTIPAGSKSSTSGSLHVLSQLMKNRSSTWRSWLQCTAESGARPETTAATHLITSLGTNWGFASCVGTHMCALFHPFPS